MLAAWALLIPPYQIPDEVQHAMRASSVLADPWVTAGDSFRIDQQRTNPVARNPGPELANLFFTNFNSLSVADVRRMKSRRWDEIPPGPEVRERWPAASYPPVYHWAVFAVAEPVTALLRLTPYQSTYAFRLASVTLAALCWGLVYLLLDQQLGAAAAARAVAMLVGIPMVSFASAGVNPDAVALPLSAAAIAAAWRLGETGKGVATTGALLVAAALAKPTGLLAVEAVGASAGLAWLLRIFGFRRAQLVAAAAAAALVFAYAVFYAWSPPRFVGTGPVQASFGEWAATVPRRAADLWMMYWGWLGWLDYRLSWPWYAWLFPLLAVNAVIAVAWL
ncbi:MAG: DUF2142 domain-containing protein, partial [Vicinamibacteraceae bacterium]